MAPTSYGRSVIPLSAPAQPSSTASGGGVRLDRVEDLAAAAAERVSLLVEHLPGLASEASDDAEGPSASGRGQGQGRSGGNAGSGSGSLGVSGPPASGYNRRQKKGGGVGARTAATRLLQVPPHSLRRIALCVTHASTASVHPCQTHDRPHVGAAQHRAQTHVPPLLPGPWASVQALGSVCVWFLQEEECMSPGLLCYILVFTVLLILVRCLRILMHPLHPCLRCATSIGTLPPNLGAPLAAPQICPMSHALLGPAAALPLVMGFLSCEKHEASSKRLLVPTRP